MISPRLRALVAVGTVGCVTALALLLVFHSAVRGFVLEPIVSAINALRRTLGYVPQDLQWLVSVLLLFVIAGAYTVSRLPKRRSQPQWTAPPRFPTEGPTMRVARILDESVRYKHRHIQLVLELRDLAARVLAQHRGISVHVAKELLDTEAWTDDPTVRAYLSADSHRRGHGDTRRPHPQVDRVLNQIEDYHQEA